MAEWIIKDVTYCVADCKNKTICYRNPERIEQCNIPHSFADFSQGCLGYEQKDEAEE